MSTPKKRFPLAGSERAPLEGAREIGAANPNETVDVTIRLRSRAGKKPIVNADEFTKPIEERSILTRKEFEQRHGADLDSIALRGIICPRTQTRGQGKERGPPDGRSLRDGHCNERGVRGRIEGIRTF